eukprot:327621-Chlamydomonas_euryale.AAC.1
MLQIAANGLQAFRSTSKNHLLQTIPTAVKRLEWPKTLSTTRAGTRTLDSHARCHFSASNAGSIGPAELSSTRPVTSGGKSAASDALMKPPMELPAATTRVPTT